MVHDIETIPETELRNEWEADKAKQQVLRPDVAIFQLAAFFVCVKENSFSDRRQVKL